MKQYAQTIDIPDLNRSLYSIVQQQVDLGVHALKSENANMAITFFQSAIGKLTVDQPFYDHLVHNLLLSYKLLIEQLYQAGEATSAPELLRDALRLEIAGEMANDSVFLQRFACAFQELGMVFFKNSDYQASVLCCRKAIAIYPDPRFQINLANALEMAGQRADLADYTTEVTHEQLGRHIFIACVPKSASTFLKNLLVSLTGYSDVIMVYAAGQNEHELYLPTICETAHLDTVTQQHCRASAANVQLMQAFEIRPVVLVRNIFDSVMSLLDFYNKGAFYNTYFRADFQSLDEETKIDLLIENVIPWYFQFVASWSLVEKRRSLDIHWLTYEELVGDKISSVKSILEFYGLGAPSRRIEEKVKEIESEPGRTRFNKGVSGRGKTCLNDRHKERIRRYARYYPSTDFSRIGL